MWTSSAPSNIALIKYMGKKRGNVSNNISLSYTLEKFTTEVTLEECMKQDVFINNISLSEPEIQRFLLHLSYIKELTDFNGYFRVSSINNFPRSAGIASSASSFAALTKCAFNAISDIKNIPTPSTHEMSAVSRRGSGSSCRSFFSPWSVWNGERADNINISINKLLHDMVLVDDCIKKISSSEAHKLVQTSLLINGRDVRAKNRFDRLLYALNNAEWDTAYQICWEEFYDMHALFETSIPHFGYFTKETIFTLSSIEDFWKRNNDGPIATVDAGANVHLLWRNDSENLRSSFKKSLIQNSFFNLKFL